LKNYAEVNAEASGRQKMGGFDFGFWNKANLAYATHGEAVG
jgi:hypothetical protein